MKPILSSVDEIVDYLMSLDEDMDEEFIRSYLEESGGEVQAELRTIFIEDLVLGPEENNETSSVKQRKYNKLASEPPPILVEDNRVIDGHHRVRSEVFKGKNEIKAYVLIYS